MNDLGPGRDAVVAEIVAAGGEAFASGASVTDPAAVNAMVAETIERFGHVDILINNAGILRDKSFAKMEMDDFRLVVDVHLMGAVYCAKAVWAHMRERQYGRIVMTTSSSGLYGNFGQSNYGAAKMGLVGFANTLAIEGAKDNIRVNCLAPTARTQMTEGLIPEAILANYTPESVSPGVLFLASEKRTDARRALRGRRQLRTRARDDHAGRLVSGGHAYAGCDRGGLGDDLRPQRRDYSDERRRARRDRGQEDRLEDLTSAAVPLPFLESPLMLAPMASSSTPRLVAAVSERGGLGIPPAAGRDEFLSLCAGGPHRSHARSRHVPSPTASSPRPASRRMKR